MAKRGRPTDYKPEYADLAYKFCLLGATTPQLAEYFEADTRTVERWANKHAEFRRAIKEGKAQADATVANSLYHRARGYSHEEEKVFCNANGEVTRVPTVKHYPPDSTACIFWLKNRAKQYWRDVQTIEDERKTARAQSLDEIDSRLAELQHQQAANG